MEQKVNYSFVASFQKMLLFCLVGMMLPFMACDDDDDVVDVDVKPNITVLLGTLGKGDNDYCSIVYKGFEKWEKNPNVTMVVHEPKTVDEASTIYRDWAKQSVKGGKSLMVVANAEYQEMVENTTLDLNANQQVLAFEMKLEKPMKGVYAFRSNHSGMAYLAGTIASVCKGATVFVGHENSLLVNATRNFREGFEKYSDQAIRYVKLSDNFEGFNMPEKAYELVKDDESRHHFILPLAGLSNQGVYNYLLECDKVHSDNEIIAAGVDVDLNALSPRIAFSYLVNIDKAIDEHLQCWFDGKPWPTSDMGLEKGITEIRFNPDFQQIGTASLEAMRKIYQENFEEAVEKDRQSK